MTENEPPSNHLGDPAELERFRTSDSVEIGRVLHDLARRAEMATLYFNGGTDFVLTSLLHIDPDTRLIYLEHGADSAANERLLKAGKILFVSSHNRIRIQFTIANIREAKLDGEPVFATPLPSSMIRLQRREFYRLSTSASAPLICRFQVGGQVIEANVVDISLGGVGLLEPAGTHGLELQTGDLLEGCTIELPDEGIITTTIEVRNQFSFTKSGTTQKRIGCRFLSLSPRMNAQIQRYIHRVELERRRRLRGDG